jgi:hypothetical protein
MEVEATLFKNYFYQAARRDGKITRKEISGTGDLTQKGILLNTFKTQQNVIHGKNFDADKNSMTLPEYMAAMNILCNQIMYSQKEINRSNQEYILKHLDEFMDADALLKSDPAFVLQVVKLRGWAIEHAHPDLRKNPTIAFAAVEHAALALRSVDVSLQEDPQFVLSVLKQNGMALPYVDYALKKTPAMIFTAIDQNSRAIEHVPSSVLTDDFLIELLGRNWKILRDPSIAERIKTSDINAPLRKYYEEAIVPVIEELKALNIEHFDRFKNSAVAKEIIENRTRCKLNDARPLALILYPKTDKHRAFRNNQMEALIQRGYRVVYYEINQENEAYQAMTEMGHGQIDLLILGGHGDQTNLAWGADDPSLGEPEAPEEFYLDVWDGPDIEQRQLKMLFKPNATVILDSCDSGKGAGHGANVANMLGRELPQCTILAPTGSTSIDTYVYDKKNVVVDVLYKRGVKSYRVGEKK